MIKGCQKEMIVMQTQDSAVFESAYFILRRQRATAGKADMLAEANRIIGAGNAYVKRHCKKRAHVWAFLLGIACGTALFALLMAIFGGY